MSKASDEAEDILIASLVNVLANLEIEPDTLMLAIVLHATRLGYSTEDLRSIHEECVRGIEDGMITYD